MKLFATVIVLWLFLVLTESENVQSAKVIIIGAGAAGIAAASTLLENNITDIIILESGSRIGGRIYSVKFGDAEVDLGAQWSYGTRNNLINDLVRGMDLIEPEPTIITAYHSSHIYLNPNFVCDLYNIFYGFCTELKHLDKEISVGEYIIPRFNEVVTKKFKGNRFLRHSDEILNLFLRSTLLADGAFTWYDASIKRDEQVNKDSINFNWRSKGFKMILDVLTKKYPHPEDGLPVEEKTQLNKEVTRIRWEDIKNTPGVVVECADGTKYEGEHVILTVSLGVLKNRHVTLFYPRLPLKKQKAIKSLGMGAIVKVFLHFLKRWWPDDNFTDFSFVWNETDQKIFKQKPWLSNLLGVNEVKHNPNVLMAWFCGDAVPKIELLSDKVVADGVMLVLKKFVGHMLPNMTEPIAVIRHNWYQDEHFRGTYSFQTVSSRKYGFSQEAVLAEPIITKYGRKPILLFAGEATHPTHYGTVHGAIETGYREANRILDFYNAQV